VKELETLCRALRGVVILDEAYVDFAPDSAMKLHKLPNVLVSRTFSKGFSLCFQRVGYFVGPAPLIAALDKIRDSYNVNGLGQVAALATLDDLPYYRRCAQKIISTPALGQTVEKQLPPDGEFTPAEGGAEGTAYYARTTGDSFIWNSSWSCVWRVVTSCCASSVKRWMSTCIRSTSFWSWAAAIGLRTDAPASSFCCAA